MDRYEHRHDMGRVITVCGRHVPHADSLYREASPFQSMRERGSVEREVIVIGSLNARIGTPVMTYEGGCVYRYDGVKRTFSKCLWTNVTQNMYV